MKGQSILVPLCDERERPLVFVSRRGRARKNEVVKCATAPYTFALLFALDIDHINLPSVRLCSALISP
jgi:hypothetical protein